MPEAIPQRLVDPAASWAEEFGAEPGGARLVPHVAVRVRLVFDERRADLDHTEEFEAIMPINTEPTDLTGMETVDYDDRDLRENLPDNCVYVIPEAKITTKSWWNTVERSVRDHLYRNRTVTVHHNPELDLWSRPGEAEEAFAQRCDAASEEREDEEAEKLRERFESKADRLREAVQRAQDRVATLQADVSSRKSSELVNIGSSILGGFLGGRKSARGIAADLRRAANKRGQTNRTEARLQSAQSKVLDVQTELAELEEELAAELLDIDHRWMEAAKAIEPVEVDLEKNDVDIVAVTLAWLPTGR